MSGIDADNHANVSVDPSIDFVLNHPNMSAWLKDSLATALDLDPYAVLNDLEILNVLFRARAARSSGF
ncbi:MAG: hypothetical protein DCF29_15565 [Alphaproteobacteria bacterium]|nr:MAG: hypothetical protein DCF29_15565 [Alphaproteobacteria bacterium]